MRPVLLPLLATLLVLTAGCESYRVEPLGQDAARNDHQPRTMRVVAVHDLLGEGVARENPRASHYIEVDVLNGPGAGGKMTLPYDSWVLGNKPPPTVGSEVTCAPADWVTRPRSVSGKGE